MTTAAVEWPWQDAPDQVACNLALGHLVTNLPRRLTVDGRIHAETYISAVGAIAGYAAQRTLFAEVPPVMGVNINRVDTASGQHYWFGDSLNFMLVPKGDDSASRCVWSLAAGSALAAGMRPQQMPALDAMFKHVASTLGGATEGRSSVPPQHQAHLPARDLLRAVWPLADVCLSGRLPGSLTGGKDGYPAAPVHWWAAIAAWASNKPIRDVKDVLSPDVALTLLMETAIYCSKLDQQQVEGAQEHQP